MKYHLIEMAITVILALGISLTVEYPGDIIPLSLLVVGIMGALSYLKKK